MGRKDTIFGVKYQKLLVRTNEITDIEMFVGAQIYISYVVISIIPITVMLAIELFYLTQFCSFLGCLFEHSPIFVTIGLWYLLDKV